MKIVTADKITDQLFSLQKYGQQRGLMVGFSNLNQYYSVKAGTSTIIFGYPTSGKSQFLIQVLVSLSCQNKKALIMTPETGSVEEIYSEIIHCLTGKTFRQGYHNSITENELHHVIPFIKDYFLVVDVDEKAPTPTEFIELTKEAIKDYGIFSSSFDNWNDLSHNFTSREDLYIEQVIPMFNRLARKELIHVFGVWHAKAPQIEKGEKFPKAPTPFDIKGGSAIYSKAMNLIGIHRDYEQIGEGWKQSSSAQISIAKVKPKSVGFKGSCTLEFDVEQNAYFEDIFGRQYLTTPFK